MTIEEAQEVLKTIKFLHFKFNLYTEEVYGHIRFRIMVEAPDTRDRSSVLPFIHNSVVPLLSSYDTKHFIDYVFHRILQLLRHEAGELFTVGKLDPFNEHHSDIERDVQLHLINKMFTPQMPMFVSPQVNLPSYANLFNINQL